MAQSAKAQEPSMEEILASIRRIIADDESRPPAPRPPEPAAARPAMPRSAPLPPAPPPRPAAAPPPPPRPVPPPVPAPPKPPAAEMDALIAGSEPRAPVAPPPPPAPDILELTEAMAGPPPPAAIPGFRTIDGQSDVVFSEEPAPAPASPAAEEGRPVITSDQVEALMSTAASAAVDSAFNSLAQTVLVHNARTLEDLVREMLRPLLKAWLDDNLPGLVERLVRAEIERVSRGRG